MSTHGDTKLAALCELLGYQYQNAALLRAALTHASYANETGGECNERLEFLGDAVLGFLAAEQLYTEHPARPEGELTRRRAAFVCEPNLAAAARRLGLGGCLLLGRGESACGGAARDSLLSDAFEAVLGSMYLDGGMEPCRALVRNCLFGEPVAEAVRDAKTMLQERAQAKGQPSPTYRLVCESGPEHEKIFCSEALVDGKPVGKGEGRSKKQSEQAAAQDALTHIYKE